MKCSLFLGNRSKLSGDLYQKTNIHSSLNARSSRNVACAVDTANAVRNTGAARPASDATATFTLQSGSLSLFRIEIPERNALEDLLEHRWKRCKILLIHKIPDIVKELSNET